MNKIEYFTNDFSKDIWIQNYKKKNENSISDTWKRVAKSVASVESTEDYRIKWEQEFYNILENFKFIPGGRILANAGSNVKNISLINCFTSPKPNYDIDSIEGIMEILKNQVLTLKSEGGWGINFSFIRPRGSYIKGIGVRTPGSVKYMELFDKSSEIITEGPGDYELEFSNDDIHPEEKIKIRKGAQIAILDIWHPDILEFIKSKQVANRLTKMNISVNVTDEFMTQLKRFFAKKDSIKSEDQSELDSLRKWKLKFPDTSFEKYASEWNGNIRQWENKGYPIKVYKTIDIEYLWNLIMKSTYNRAEPGILFLDRSNKTFCANYLDNLLIDACNPCLCGDTKVYVADGRGFVEIQKLAESNKDVPVYCCDYSGNVVVRQMLHPRITAFNVDVYEIKFNDGSCIRCTNNHKFLLASGLFKEIKDLKEYDKVHVKRFIFCNGVFFNNQENESENNHENNSIVRYCESCGKLIDGITYNNREQCFCSDECYSNFLEKSENKNIFFNDTEFRTVEKIVYLGKQNVYNGTVKEYHNFYILGLEKKINNSETEYTIFNCKNCGEQQMAPGSACDLGSINLTQFVKLSDEDDSIIINKEDFERTVKVAVRFLDNVIDIANMPLNIYNENALKYRRIGLGITGIGSALMMLKIPYGSEKSKKFLNEILNIYNYAAIEESLKLGKEKGGYYSCNIFKHMENIRNTFKKLPDELHDKLLELAKECGTIRNTALFSIQPTGNTGCLANNISGGVEPVFSLKYFRSVNVPKIPSNLKDKVPRFWENDFTPNKYFVQKESAGTTYLEYIDDSGVIYNIYKDRGLCMKQPIMDYAFNYLLSKNKNLNLNDDYLNTATQLSVDEHIDILKVVSCHLDSSASKTINIPSNYDYNDFKNVYINAYDSGVIKGVTTYREGTMNAVLTGYNSVQKNSEVVNNSIIKTNAPKRPKTLKCDLHLVSIDKHPYYAIVGLLNNDPYEVFIGANEEDLYDSDNEYIGRRVIFKKSMIGKDATLTKESRGIYKFQCGNFEYQIVRKNENDYNAMITLLSRSFSTALRHGADVKFLADQCDKTEGSFSSIAKIFSRTFKKYINTNIDTSEKCPKCGGNIIKKEGCKSCLNCGWSACS